MQRETEAASAKHGSIEITVDGRPITLDDPETTPNEVLRLAGLDLATTRAEGFDPTVVQGIAVIALP